MMRSVSRFVAFVAILLHTAVSAGVVTAFPAAPGVRSGDYAVRVANRDIPVLAVPMPEERLAADLRQPYSFCIFEADEEVDIEVSSTILPVAEAEILPQSRGAVPVERIRSGGSGGKLHFRARPPFKLVVEPTRRDRALVLLGYVPEVDVPKKGDRGVVWFGPGRHRRDIIELHDNETLYLAGGSWVEGTLHAEGTNITVCGRGILSGASWGWQKGPKREEEKPINYSGRLATLSGHDLVVRDVTFHSSMCWTLVLNAVTNAVVEGVNVLGGRVINDDGIDVCRARNVVIRNSFVRCQDDCVTPKWWCENLVCTNLILWTDVANIVRIGYECEPPPLRFDSLVFRDLDILHLTTCPSKTTSYWCNCAFLIQASRGQRIGNVRFEDIRFHEVSPWDILFVAKTMSITTFYDFKEPGTIENVILRDVRLPVSPVPLPSRLEAKDMAHPVRGVRFENVNAMGPVETCGFVEYE